MIDLLNRIGFKQIAFGGESSGGSGGGSGSGRTDGPDETLVTRGDSYAYDPYEDADLYDAGGYQQEYSGPDYGGNDNNDNNDRDDRQPTPPPPPPPPPPPAPAPITYDPYEDASLYGDGGYQQEYSGSNYGGSSNNSVFDAGMLSQITNIRGTKPFQTNWVGNTTQEAINLNPNSRFDFDLADAYETETTGAPPSSDIVAGGLGVSPVPKPRPGNLVVGRSPIEPTVTVSTKNALTTPQTFGALPDGVTQQMITDSQNDGEYGYYNNDGSYVPKEIDKYNGGGPDYSGVRFASGGGAQFDLDGDRFLSKTEMRIGEEAGKELDQNFWSKAGTGLGGTPLGSGQDPTGVAKWAEKLIVPGGSTLRKLNPPAFERPLSSYDPTNPYADVGEDAPNIWWEKGKTNPIGFEYKRTPAEVLADRTASREKAAIDAANEITNNDNDNGPRTRREDLYGTRMTTEEYRRRYKGGSGAALPAYMRKYASGKSIDELVRKVKVNGKDYFLTPDGRYIEPSAFTGAAASRDLDVVETGEEQYLEGYNVIDESTGIITTYNTDGSIMEVFDPNFESEEA
jgi:hypothetical protein